MRIRCRTGWDMRTFGIPCGTHTPPMHAEERWRRNSKIDGAERIKGGSAEASARPRQSTGCEERCIHGFRSVTHVWFHGRRRVVFNPKVVRLLFLPPPHIRRLARDLNTALDREIDPTVLAALSSSRLGRCVHDLFAHLGPNGYVHSAGWAAYCDPG